MGLRLFNINYNSIVFQNIHLLFVIGTFKVSVVINNANNLPSRKRCRSKRSKNVANKNADNILPSCYVSFEHMPGESLKVTSVISKSTNPTWNFKCNVNLPLELLQNVS